MNEIINKFLLAGDKYMPEMHYKHWTYLLKIMKEYKNLKNQEIQDISTEMSLIKLASTLYGIWRF